VVLGDLNDHPDLSPLSALTTQGLADLTLRVEKAERYTYIYRGISQVMDYVLFYSQPGLGAVEILPQHFNADYPYVLRGDGTTMLRSSDHDPVVVCFSTLDWFNYLPLVTR